LWFFMTVIAHKIRLAPTSKQEAAFTCACGVARFAWNWGLQRWGELYRKGEKTSGYSIKSEWNSIKRKQFPWVYDSPKNANERPFLDLHNAFQGFFNRTSKYPKYKKKGDRDSFYVSNDRFKFNGKCVYIPVIGWVKTREILRFDGKILSARIVRNADQWYIAVQVELYELLPRSSGCGVIGVDLGLTHFATLSTGEKVENIKALEHGIKKIKRLSQGLSRKQPGSKNREKAKQRLSRAHLKIKNTRQDVIHKVTSRLIHENQVIVIETLNVSGMVKNRCLSRAISDVGWGEFRRQVLYKGELYGVDVILADRFYPSSKTCSACGCVKDKLKLSECSYHCSECGLIMDRDVNAACNLLALGLRVSACGEESSGYDLGCSETIFEEAGIAQCSI
jgi:putative transposase